MITRFTGDYAFLSNFSPHEVLCETISEIPFQTAEHAFQAAKTMDRDAARFVATAPTPGEAKKRGRHVPLRPDWERVRRRVMLEILLAKFNNEPDEQYNLAAQLAATEGTLVEGNTWGDRYWGAIPMQRGTYGPDAVVWPPEDAEWSGPEYDRCWLVGQNWLGRCLMLAREVIRP